MPDRPSPASIAPTRSDPGGPRAQEYGRRRRSGVSTRIVRAPQRDLPTLSFVTQAPWPPPTTAPAGRTGWYLASDGRWYLTSTPPAEGYRLADDGRWYSDGDAPEAWLASRWGLGDFWWGMLAQLVVSLLASLVIAGAIAASRPEESITDVEFGAYAVGALVLANAVAFLGIPWLATRRKGLRSLARDFGLRVRGADIAIGFGLGVGALFAAGLVSVAIDAALGADDPTSNIPVDDLDTTGEFVVFLLAVGVLTPIIEELFFRGLVYRSFLKRGSSATAAIGLTTLLFVLPHLPAVTEWPGVLTLFASIAVLGLAFNLACYLTGGRLAAPIVAHMVINCSATLVLFFA